MKLWESLVLSASVGFFLIGIHQLFLHGLVASYWLFMISVIGLVVLNLKKRPLPKPETPPKAINKGKKGKPQLSSTQKKRK
jgi:hypothetical protein